MTTGDEECEIASEIDLAAYLCDPSAREWSHFRLHFPFCAKCAQMVSVWTEMEMGLRGESNEVDVHPEPARLSRYSQDAVSLDASERNQIADHLDFCRSCSSELKALESFDFSLLDASAAAESQASPERRTTLIQDEGWLQRITGWLNIPSLAVPVGVGAVLVLTSAVILTRANDPTPDTEMNVAEIAPDPKVESIEIAPDDEFREPANDSAIAAIAPASGDQDSRAMSEKPATTVSHADPVRVATAPTINRAESEPTSDLADVAEMANPIAIEADSAVGARERPLVPSDDEPTEHMLLAALSSYGMPNYAPPLYPTDVSWLRELDVLRGVESRLPPSTREGLAVGEAVAIPIPTALVPSHVGQSILDSPRLWWHLSSTSNVPVEILINAEQEAKPTLRLTLSPPVAAGFHVIDLADHSVTLKPETQYRWFVSVVRNPDAPAQNPRSGGGLLRVQLNSDLARAIADRPLAERIQPLAEASIWYDAFDQVSTGTCRYPELIPLTEQRAGLLKTVGIELQSDSVRNGPETCTSN